MGDVGIVGNDIPSPTAPRESVFNVSATVPLRPGGGARLAGRSGTCDAQWGVHWEAPATDWRYMVIIRRVNRRVN